MKVYLSGKITGDSNYRQKFSTMTEELLSYGYVVFNPGVLPDGFEYSDYMALDLLILSRCDTIFLLRDWKKSSGARLEYEEAKRLGLQVLTEDDLKIRRTLNQLCEDTIKLTETDLLMDDDKEWAESMKNISLEIKKMVGEFDLSKSEVENFIELRSHFEATKRISLFDEFILECDKQIEYDLLEIIHTDEDEKKRRFSQMLIAAGDLMDMAVNWKDERESA